MTSMPRLMGAGIQLDAYISREVPIKLCPDFNIPGDVETILDVVYIPTQAHRTRLGTPILRLLEVTREVILLCSGDEPPWGPSYQPAAGYSSILNLGKAEGYQQFRGLPSSQNVCQSVDDGYDLPFKRNVALAHARRFGHRRIALLDDDIGLSLEDLRRATTAIDVLEGIVGFHVLDYPDVSALDHVVRVATKEASPVSLGGNCIFFDPNKVAGFFPYIYNEDWLFLFENMRRGTGVFSIGTALQFPHEPWRSTKRVRFEQFGDALIHGAKRNFVRNVDYLAGDRAYWEDVLSAFALRLASAAAQPHLSPEMVSSICVGTDIIETLSPDQIEKFIFDYRADLEAFGG